MKKFALPFLALFCMLMSACNDNEIYGEKLVGTWLKQYPAGLQTEGFVDWNFSSGGVLTVEVYDVFAGDDTSTYMYAYSDENKTFTVSGDLILSDGSKIHDDFAIYSIQKLTDKDLQIKQTWLNPKYDNLEATLKNSFLLGSYKDVKFKRMNK